MARDEPTLLSMKCLDCDEGAAFLACRGQGLRASRFDLEGKTPPSRALRSVADSAWELQAGSMCYRMQGRNDNDSGALRTMTELPFRESNLERAVALRCPNCDHNDQLVVVVAMQMPRLFICGSCGALVTVSKCKNADGDMVFSPNHQTVALVALDSLVEWWKERRPTFLATISDEILASAEDN
jgi:hypothetical protein